MTSTTCVLILLVFKRITKLTKAHKSSHTHTLRSIILFFLPDNIAIYFRIQGPPIWNQFCETESSSSTQSPGSKISRVAGWTVSTSREPWIIWFLIYFTVKEILGIGIVLNIIIKYNKMHWIPFWMHNALFRAYILEEILFVVVAPWICKRKGLQ